MCVCKGLIFQAGFSVEVLQEDFSRFFTAGFLQKDFQYGFYVRIFSRIFSMVFTGGFSVGFLEQGFQ